MPTKIRLQRHGKKGRPFYHMVVTDSRAPRDGKYIERLGVYNPLTQPATIEIDTNRTLDWMMKGAQPSDTCKAILSYKGLLFKKHLQVGVLKGALTQEQADEKFSQWLEEKNSKINKATDAIHAARNKKKDDQFAVETKQREEKAAQVLAKTSELSAEVSAEENAEDTVDEVAPEASAEVTPSTEEGATEESTPSEEAN
ncbi:MAG TPA: 30S ribosomal protein S16 [Bacteroidia bacterium]|nr:30S ribosomal protein S16 [Bacteroidia bacterium]HNT81099.1 30S ribosomal protein S16 [Bacteroidia bacterium]